GAGGAGDVRAVDGGVVAFSVRFRRRLKPAATTACSGRVRVRCVEEGFHFVIRGLGEVVVPVADGQKRLGRVWADDFIGEFAQIHAGFRGADGDGDDNASGRLPAQGLDGGTHGGAGGEAVVDKDDGAVAHPGIGTIATEGALAAGEFDFFFPGDG